MAGAGAADNAAKRNRLNGLVCLRPLAQDERKSMKSCRRENDAVERSKTEGYRLVRVVAEPTSMSWARKANYGLEIADTASLLA